MIKLEQKSISLIRI